MKKSKLLVLESSHDLRVILSYLLGQYEIIVVGSVDEANSVMRNNYFDLALLDVASGGEHSRTLRFIRSLRENGERLPIIATSALADPNVGINALRAGSDDFVRKPWKSMELVARIDGHIERHHEHGASADKKAGGVYLHGDFNFGRAKVGSDFTLSFGRKETRLLAKQYAMLWVFHTNGGQLVTREALRREVWGPATNAGVSSMTEYVSRLRKAFFLIGLDFDELVQTQSGIGYHVSPLAGAIGQI